MVRTSILGITFTSSAFNLKPFKGVSVPNWFSTKENTEREQHKMANELHDAILVPRAPRFF